VQCGPFDQAVDVYLNNVSSKAFSYDPSKLPVDPTWGPVNIRELHTFWTGHELHPSGPSADSYTFHVFAIAVDPVTNLSVNIAQFAIVNSLDGFTISSRGAEAMKRFNYDTDGGPKTVEIESRALDVQIRHSKSAKMLNICIFATNWALTLVSTYIACKATTTGRVDFAVVLVHGSMVLAISSIRKLYVSPPPFGAFTDSVGFFSQIAIVALSSVMLLYTASKSYLSTKTPSRRLENPEKA